MVRNSGLIKKALCSASTYPIQTEEKKTGLQNLYSSQIGRTLQFHEKQLSSDTWVMLVMSL